MALIDDITGEVFAILRDAFNKADVWDGAEDGAFVRELASEIAARRVQMIHGSEPEKAAAQEDLKFLHLTVENKILQKKIKLKGFGQSVVMAIVETVARVAIKTALGGL